MIKLHHIVLTITAIKVFLIRILRIPDPIIIRIEEKRIFYI